MGEQGLSFVSDTKLTVTCVTECLGH